MITVTCWVEVRGKALLRIRQRHDVGADATPWEIFGLWDRCIERARECDARVVMSLDGWQSACVSTRTRIIDAVIAELDIERFRADVVLDRWRRGEPTFAESSGLTFDSICGSKNDSRVSD